MNILPKIIDPNFPRVTLTQFKGILYMHLDSDWIQGGMRLSDPIEIVLAYTQCLMSWMLFNSNPKRILQLGLGCGSLTRFTHHFFEDAETFVVEINPNVIQAAHQTFCLPPENKHLHIIQGDAYTFVMSSKNHNLFDILQVDLYDENAQAPLFDSQEFYEACANCLTDNGILTINIFGEKSNRAQTIKWLSSAFDAVAWLPEVDDGNVIAIAFKKSPSISFQELETRANDIRMQTKLRADKWIEGLKQWEMLTLEG